MSHPPWFSVAACLVLLGLAGCASWSVSDTEPQGLPSPHMAADCVALEVALVKVPADLGADPDLWSQVDESPVPMDVRRRLAENGLRAGIVGTQLPDALRRWLDRRPGALELAATAATPEQSELFSRQQRLQLRAGKKKRVPVTPATCGEDVLLLADEGAVRTVRIEKPQGVFEILGEPLGDGRVRLEITPEVEHGEPKQRWAGVQGSWVARMDREHQVFDTLAFETVLSPGQTLLVTGTADAKGLGRHLFVPCDAGPDDRSIILLRLAQTRWDDLFSTPAATTPLTPVAD